jgi:hypothetical protein
MPDPEVVDEIIIFEELPPVPVADPMVFPEDVPILTLPDLTTMALKTPEPGVDAPLAVVQLIPLIVFPRMSDAGIAATAVRSIPVKQPPLFMNIPVPDDVLYPMVFPLILYPPPEPVLMKIASQ